MTSQTGVRWYGHVGSGIRILVELCAVCRPPSRGDGPGGGGVSPGAAKTLIGCCFCLYEDPN